MISFVLSEIIGSGQGSGSRPPVATTVTLFFVTFVFFGLGPSAEVLMEVAASVEMIGVGSHKMLLLHGWSGSGDSPLLVKPMKLNGPSTTAMLLEYSSPVIPSDVEGYIQ